MSLVMEDATFAWAKESETPTLQKYVWFIVEMFRSIRYLY